VFVFVNLSLFRPNNKYLAAGILTLHLENSFP
jgi:hypothetical protein